MGTIFHISTQKSVVLAAHSVVGRASTHLVRLTDPVASNDHASITWTGERWEVRDLGSTYGTFVNNVLVPLKERVGLSRGDVLRFGADSEQWKIMDARGPVVAARCVTTNEEKFAANDILVLPDETNIDVSLLRDVDGRWLVEFSDGSRRNAQNGERIEIAGHKWELEVPPEVSFVGTYKTKTPLSLATVTLRFQLSHDGDHVGIDILHGDDEVRLGTKTLFDLLGHLAQERWKDAQDGDLPEADHGWYDMQELVAHLGKKEQYVNVLIFRIREAFSEAGIEGAEGIVERRPKQLRLGTGRILGITG